MLSKDVGWFLQIAFLYVLQSVIAQINDFGLQKSQNRHRVVGDSFMQITAPNITWQENLILRFPAKEITSMGLLIDNWHIAYH